MQTYPSVEPTAEQIATWRAEHATNELRRTERAEREREYNERARQAPIEAAEKARTELATAAAPSVEYRARRIGEINALLAEIAIVQAAEQDRSLRMAAHRGLETIAETLRSELFGLEAIGTQLSAIAEAKVALARAPRRVTLPDRPGSPDDVMLIVASPERAPLFHAIVDGVFEETWGSSLCFVPRAAWDGIVKAKIDDRREQWMTNKMAFSTTNRRATSEAHAAGLAREREQEIALLEKQYERESIMVVDGDERWSPLAIMRRLGAHVPSDAYQAPERIGNWCTSMTSSARVLIRWYATLNSSGQGWGSTLGTHIAYIRDRVDLGERPDDAVAWWRKAGVE